MPEGTPAATTPETGTTQPSMTPPGAPSWEENAGAGGQDAVLADLAKTRKEAREAAAEAEELRKWKAERETADMGELEKAQKLAADALTRAEKAERDALIRQVALDKGLPKGLAGRLQGKNQAELEADADELLKLVPAGAPHVPGSPLPDPTQGSKQSAPVSGAK